MTQVKGVIEYHGLSDWWQNEITTAEKEIILTTYNPMGSSPNEIIEANICFSSGSAVQLVGSIASWLNKIEHIELAKKLFVKAENLINSRTPILDVHFLFQNEIITYYKKEKKYDSFLKSITSPSVLVIDEIGYFNMSKEEANHFFQIISKRYEKSSTIFTSNLVFSKWVQVFAGDKIVTTAILDRVLHHSHIINIQGDSYRLKEKKQTGVLHSEIYKFEAKSSNQSSQNSEVV